MMTEISGSHEIPGFHHTGCASWLTPERDPRSSEQDAEHLSHERHPPEYQRHDQAGRQIKGQQFPDGGNDPLSDRQGSRE